MDMPEDWFLLQYLPPLAYQEYDKSNPDAEFLAQVKKMKLNEILAEYNLIQQKKSSLSKRQREIITGICENIKQHGK